MAHENNVINAFYNWLILLMESWKFNLIFVWVGCFFTGMAMSQIIPFLPLFIEQLGVSEHDKLALWAGLIFSVTFVVSAAVSPLWGRLADRKGRRLMMLRASLGMSVLIFLQAFVTEVWQLLALRALMGLTSGYIPNAMALMVAQIPRGRSGWGLGTVSTGQISGVIIGPMLGGLLADVIGLRAVFMVTSALLLVTFLFTLLLVKEINFQPVNKAKMLTGREVFRTISNPVLIFSLFFTTLIIQLCNGSVTPVLTLFVRQLEPQVHNLAFISGVIAALPGMAALMSAPGLGRLGDRIGTERILIASLIMTVMLFIAMSQVNSAWQLGVCRFIFGFFEGAMMPAVQTLLLRFTSDRVIGRIFGYNQSFMYMGNVVGPLVGSAVSALGGFRWVFIVTALFVLINIIQLVISWYNRSRINPA